MYLGKNKSAKIKTGITFKQCRSWARGYKIFSMLNSVEDEIVNAHKYKNIKKFSFFQTLISRECFFSC